jgi:SsrA-binding protein
MSLTSANIRDAACPTRAERLMMGMWAGCLAFLSRPVPCENDAMGKTAGKDKGKSAAGGTIALNKRARHEYHLEDRFEAGMALQGWELKAIRAGRANITESYAVVRSGEIFLFGAQITPLLQASTHVVADDRRTRKLLLHRREIDMLVGKVERDGYTIVPSAMYWKGNKVKIEISLAKGKQTHDKRDAAKDRDWARDKQRVMRRHNRDA